MENDKKKWIYLLILSLVWGSSYILIKKGLLGLTPLQLGALRITFSTIFLFIIGFKSLFTITKAQRGFLLVHYWVLFYLYFYLHTQRQKLIAVSLRY
ncbi:EamA family transporter [Leeuwenhoekiella aequorea]|uniref:EamA family transporter n=1 Tax=Leeuwenhoekiella aequorea TaxID=283736 RepID=UPI00352F027A